MTPALEAAERLMKAGIGGFADSEDLRLVCEAVREKCASPGVAQCAKLWESDHQRAALEALGLADEFPYGCDAIAFVAAALIAARAQLADMPRRRERPTCIGWWVVYYPMTNDGSETYDVQYISEDEMADDWDGLTVYGPIPPQPDKEQA